MRDEVHEYLLQALIIALCCLFLIGIQFLPTTGKAEDEVFIKGTPTEVFEADPPTMEMQEAWIASDTPEEDADSDNFEMLVSCCFAESGNQSERGQRLVVDSIGNRAGWDMAKVDDVISAPYQFSSYSDGGMEKWRDSITEEFIQLVADEWMRADKACGNTQVWYFRTGHYSEYGTPWQKIGDHYFNTRGM